MPGWSGRRGRLPLSVTPPRGPWWWPPAREGVDQEKEEQNWPRTADLPFDSGRKLMSTIHAREDGSWTVFVKGAPDILLERCVAGPRGPLSAQDRRAVLEANEAMAQKALRVIAVARRGAAHPAAWAGAAGGGERLDLPGSSLA